MCPKYKVCIISIIACAAMAALKYVIASFSGSLTLKADALHSLLDMMTSMLVLLSVFLDTKEFKHQILKKLPVIIKYSVFASIIVLTGYLGFSIFMETRNISQSPPQGEFFVAFICIVSIIVSHFLYRYQKRIGQEHKSLLITADAFETRIDQITSFLVLVSISTIIMGFDAENTFVTIILIFLTINLVKWCLEFTQLVSWNSSKTTQIISNVIKNGYSSIDLTHIYKHKKVIKRSALICLFTMLLIYILSGFYTLKPGQVAIIQYFGKYVDTLGKSPGLNYVVPFPFGKKKIVELDEIKRLEIKNSDQSALQYIITKDENLIDASISLQYKIGNVYDYYFKNVQTIRVLEDLVESTTSKIVGEFSVDDALVHKKQYLLSMVKTELQELVEKNHLGIRIVGVQFKKNAPPNPVISAFNEVSSAREDKRTYIDLAQQYQNKTLPTTRGQAFELIQKAIAFKQDKIERAIGDSDKLKQLFGEYKRSPYSYKSKSFLELMSLIAPKVKLEIIDPKTSRYKKLRLYKNESSVQ